MRQPATTANLKIVNRASLLPLFLAVIAVFGCSGSDSSAPEPKQQKEEQTPKQEVDEVSEDKLDDSVEEFADAGLVTKKPMFLEFTSDGCLPCKLMEPWIKQLKKAVGDKVEVVEINISKKENVSLAKYFRVIAVPVQIVVDGRGVVVARNNGIATFEQMKKMVEKVVRLEE